MTYLGLCFRLWRHRKCCGKAAMHVRTPLNPVGRPINLAYALSGVKRCKVSSDQRRLYIMISALRKLRWRV